MASTDPIPVVQAELLRHAEQLKGFIAALVADRDAAEDCFQELFLTITAKAADFTPGTDFLAWACTIARYKVLQHLERRRRHGGGLDPETIAALAADEDAYHDAWDERREALAACLDGLAPAARRLVDARYVHGLAPAAIAAASGRSANGVSVALAKARDALEACIARRLAARDG